MHYLERHEELVSRLIVGIIGVAIWLVEVLNLLTKSPWPSKYLPIDDSKSSPAVSSAWQSARPYSSDGRRGMAWVYGLGLGFRVRGWFTVRGFSKD